MAKSKTKPSARRYTLKSHQVPVTQAMLFLVRDELKADIAIVHGKIDAVSEKTTFEIKSVRAGARCLQEEMTSEFKSVRAEISGLREEMTSEFKSVRAEISCLREEMKSEFKAVRAEMTAGFKEMTHKMDSSFHKLQLLMEEQNARNIFVLDGLSSLFHRQEKLEHDMIDMRKEWEFVKKQV